MEDIISLKNKVCIITGVGKGIGYETAIAFRNQGAKLGLITRNKKDLNKLLKVLGACDTDICFQVGDVSDESTVKSFVSMVFDKFKKIIDKLECDPLSVKSEGIDAFIQERTLEELVADIERTLSANKPEVAIDHLHTYFVKKLTHLLKVRNIECSENEPLHSRFGKYRKALVQEHNLHEFSDRAMKSSISLLESFNDLRNNHSLAHDNKILDPIEARYIFSSINAILVLLRALETTRYEE